MLGDLLEDVDPCETVEYVIPLLNGFAVDEGKWRASFCDLHIAHHFPMRRRIGEGGFRVGYTPHYVALLFCECYPGTAPLLLPLIMVSTQTCKLIDDDGEESPDILPGVAALPDPDTDHVIIVTSEGLRTVRKPTLELPDAPISPSPADLEDVSPASTVERNSTTLSTSTATSSTPGTFSTPGTLTDTPQSTLSSRTTISDKTAFSPSGIMPSIGEVSTEVPKDNGPLVNRPSIAVHIFTPMLGSMLLSQNSLVADPTRAALVSVLAKLRGQAGPLDWEISDCAGERRTYMSQSGVHQHDVYPFSKFAKSMVEKELLQRSSSVLEDWKEIHLRPSLLKTLLATMAKLQAFRHRLLRAKDHQFTVALLALQLEDSQQQRGRMVRAKMVALPTMKRRCSSFNWLKRQCLGAQSQ